MIGVFSHWVETYDVKLLDNSSIIDIFEIPAGVEVKLPSQTDIVLTSIDNVLLGQAAANIRAFRPPEPYKGKGVRYADEQISLKEVKV